MQQQLSKVFMSFQSVLSWREGGKRSINDPLFLNGEHLQLNSLHTLILSFFENEYSVITISALLFPDCSRRVRFRNMSLMMIDAL